MQTRKHSILEAVVNVSVGFGISFGSQLVVFPLVGIEAGLDQNLAIGGCFTVISIVRQYVIRRWFNAKVMR